MRSVYDNWGKQFLESCSSESLYYRKHALGSFLNDIAAIFLHRCFHASALVQVDFENKKRNIEKMKPCYKRCQNFVQFWERNTVQSANWSPEIMSWDRNCCSIFKYLLSMSLHGIQDKNGPHKFKVQGISNLQSAFWTDFITETHSKDKSVLLQTPVPFSVACLM